MTQQKLDREKVIKGLEMCIADDFCNGCPYEEHCFSDGKITAERMMRDALDLLKEAVKPEKEYSGSGITWWNVCGNCKTAINPNDKYCHECGRAVKWE